MAFATAYRFFVKRRGGQIPIHMLEIAEAMGFKTKGRHYSSLNYLAVTPGIPVGPDDPANKA
jgi:hypothetical protein